MNTSEKRLSKLTLFAYGMGDFASNLCWTFIGSYLSVFYTDVVGMAPAIASAIMLIAKIWDGVNDPMFGAIAERTNTKRGRFRPYILFGAPILAVLSVLAFTTIGRGNAAVIYAAITYIGCGMAYTVVNLSYGSLSTVMTTNPEDIAQLNSWNEFKLCSAQCDYRAAFDEIFRRLRKLHRRRLHKGGNFICDLCFAIVLFCICKLQGNHQAGSRCYQGIRWNSIIK